MAQSLMATCWVCRKKVEREENYCYGCGKVICENARHWNFNRGFHDKEAHGQRWAVKRKKK